MIWGTVATAAGIEWAFAAAAVGVAVGVLIGSREPLLSRELDLRPAGEWSEPHLVVDPEARDGPVLVTVEWYVAAEQQEAFREAMQLVERTRRRTGARRWGLYRDGGDATRFIEAYTVATWEEHVRQVQRFTVRDREIEQTARDLASAEPDQRWYFGVGPEPRGRRRR